jgi:hypothetical protein
VVRCDGGGASASSSPSSGGASSSSATLGPKPNVSVSSRSPPSWPNSDSPACSCE